MGIEFSAGRCEVWTRADGIQASIAASRHGPRASVAKALDGFTCLRHLESEDILR